MEKKTYGYYGLVLFQIVWFLYFVLPTQFTLILIPFHYISLFLLASAIMESKHKALYFFTILIASFCLDYFVYDPIHELHLNFFYYIFVNQIHGLFFLAAIAYFEKQNYVIILILAIISFIAWMTLPFEDAALLALPDTIFILLYF